MQIAPRNDNGREQERALRVEIERGSERSIGRQGLTAGPLGPASLSPPVLLADRQEMTLGLSHASAASQKEAGTAVFLDF